MSRIDIIGQNGNDGDHYESFCVCVICESEISENDIPISATECHRCRAEEAAKELSRARRSLDTRTVGRAALSAQKKSG